MTSALASVYMWSDLVNRCSCNVLIFEKHCVVELTNGSDHPVNESHDSLEAALDSALRLKSPTASPGPWVRRAS